MLNRAFDKIAATESTTMKKTNVNDERGLMKKKVYSYLLSLPHLTNEHSHHLIIIVIHAFNGPSHFGTHDIPWKHRICHTLIYENIISNIKIRFNCYPLLFFCELCYWRVGVKIYTLSHFSTYVILWNTVYTISTTFI